MLSLLAAGSFLTLFLGIPYAWTHRAPLLEHFLEPSLPGRVQFAELPHVLEYVFQGLGVLAATVGWLSARALYKDGRSEVPARLKARFQGIWTVVYNKYYVDEIYDAALVQPIRTVSEQGLWQGVDQGVIDGAVNGAAVTVRGASGLLRRLQTGSIRAYAASLFVGVLLLLAYVLWPRG